MDLEGFVRRRLGSVADNALAELLGARISEHKKIAPEEALALAKAVIDEVAVSLKAQNPICSLFESGVAMGQFGVGSRGTGDMFAHRCIAEIIGKTGATVDATDLDDAGVVKTASGFVVVTVDGMHSRLSEFPFLAGFHVARAALRDVWAMGAEPQAMLADVHVADDGDVSRVFEFVAGIAAVGEAVDVPLVTGSTLRIGGDLVLGERLTGCVGAVGQATSLAARSGIAPGDKLLMTEGAGGGTISTAAIYGGYPHVLDETLDVQFLDACRYLSGLPLWSRLHAMTDVTNGGLRGDAHEMASTTGLGIVVDQERACALVAPAVSSMLQSLEIDPMGVSIDSLLIAGEEADLLEAKEALVSMNIRADIIGHVRERPGVKVLIDGKEQDFTPKFRESPYTPVKKVVGERTPEDFDEMARKVQKAADAARAKKSDIVRLLKARQKRSTP